MSEFLLDEAMGANRVDNINQQQMLLGAGEDDSAYDNFFANRPEGDLDAEGAGIGGGQHNPIVEPRAQGDDDDYQTAQDHESEAGDVDSMDGHGSQRDGGLIEEESVRGASAQLPGQVVPAAGAGAAGPVTNFSSEGPGRVFDPAQWPSGRSDKIKGQYWKTFGERKAAIGGGIGGFFGALFGGGMRRANRVKSKRAFLDAPILQARAWRQQRKADGAEAVPARSALRTRLAGPKIENLSTFPREPGVAYDEPAASAAHAGFMQGRAQHHDAYEDGSQDALAGNIASIGGTARGKDAERTMKSAYARYDAGVGNQTLFGRGATRADDQATALVDANRRAGADIFANMGRPRRTPQRVRFKDGDNDAVGQPVNDPSAGPENKPMPTGVRFFPAPIGERSFQRDLGGPKRQLKRSPEYQELNEEQKEQRMKAFVDEHMAGPRRYVASLGETGHPDEISDEQALENARFAWPVRARMMRMNDMDRIDATSRHELNAMNLEVQSQRDGTDPLQSDNFRDQYLRQRIGEDTQRDLEEKRAQDGAKRIRRSMATEGLGAGAQHAFGNILRDQGARIDPNVDLSKQMPRLPRNFFDAYLNDGFEQAQANAGAGQGGGGARLIQEEPDPRS